MEKVKLARITPEHSLNVLSQIEVSRLAQASDTKLYDNFRRCALAVLNTGEKTDNTSEILEAYKDFSIRVIAQERGIQPSTVENHLAKFVTTGEIQLHELVPLDKVEPIRNAVLKFNDTGQLSPIKEFLGDDYTYGEIRAVIASM